MRIRGKGPNETQEQYDKRAAKAQEKWNRMRERGAAASKWSYRGLTIRKNRKNAFRDDPDPRPSRLGTRKSGTKKSSPKLSIASRKESLRSRYRKRSSTKYTRGVRRAR